MKINKFLKLWQILLVLPLIFAVSCSEDDDPAADPIASFQAVPDTENFLKVNFVNASTGANAYSWNFGDASAASTEENPSHTYAAAGTYTVVLTAENADGVTDTFDASVTITDPEAALKMITGETSKTWKLFREGTAMSLGPNADDPAAWWGGLTNDGTRNCLYEQTITFGLDGSYVFDDMGMFWAEYGLFNNVGGCDQNTPESCIDVTGGSITNACGDDISAFLSGSHTFTYESSTGTMTLNGMGAWIGIPKLGTSGERITPEESTSFKVSIEEFTGYDVMTVEFVWAESYWVARYASYSDTSLEPGLTAIAADFTISTSGKTATFTNTTTGATTFSWAFGDGGTSTEENPSHEYAEDGTYSVTLTAMDGADSGTKTKDVIIDTAPPTEAAPTPSQAEADVISIYSDAYAALDGLNTNPNWGQATVVSELEIVSGDNAMKLAGLNYQGIDWTGTAGGSIDVSGKTMVHVDVWTKNVETVNLSLIGGGAENPVALTTEAGVWKSFDIPLSDYTSPDKTATIQFKFDDAGSGTSPTIYYDNLYFY